MGAHVSRHVDIPGMKRHDNTAMGVARIRWMEHARKPEASRLFEDPYAKYFSIGHPFLEWLGSDYVVCKVNQRYPGLISMVVARTAFLDHVCHQAITDHACTQMIILGAGYDTRAIRLFHNNSNNNSTKIHCFEVDQPKVQKLKKLGLQSLPIQKGELSHVHLISVDFNSNESLQDKLEAHPQFQRGAKTIILLEGVTYYIPKKSTAETLKQLQSMVGKGSILGVSYVHQAVLQKKSELSWIQEGICADPQDVARVVARVRRGGEPWISGWTPEEFTKFLKKDHGFVVLEDVTVSDLESRYFEPLGRTARPFLCAERFVMAQKA
ncbi:Putative S-adenosyl-L-methionine-dependent methyltransferase [Seminavis robusta]|uniref:S-adenosyl-L-methionine-dependent methyltransferase n=1 Tax=Seminavis robusta TaxID=568900 RepID=A0A9N8H147_9STRA|nr:Putative S-adenosyl-L-methionine-dependent methyltransferase [Seminavis robusta]|eukprot:Sro33_g021240.1 Putative S-adenosyl-L-methionine-dependent methyltransferase (324) ;mRNA; r:21348-22319